MKLSRFALLAAMVLALFAARPSEAEAGVSIQVGPHGIYVGRGYGYYYPRYYYPRYYGYYYYPRRYYYPRYYYPRYYRRGYYYKKKRYKRYRKYRRYYW